MALGFTSHYKPGEQAFGALTQMAYTGETESSGTIANMPSIIIGQDSSLLNNSINYDSCEFSSSVIIDYSQYATIVDSSGTTVETAGSIAFSGGDFSSGISTTGSTASFSGGGASLSGGGGGGMSCASFTC